MGLRAVGDIFKIIRELNLKEMQEEAKKSFSLLLVGNPTLTQSLAELLSPSETGIHPAITTKSLPLATDNLKQHNLSVVITEQGPISDEAGEALRRLRKEGVPVLHVLVGGSASGENRQTSYGAARVVLPSLTADAVRSKAVPALVQAAPDDLRLALARQLPVFRDNVIGELIEDTSRANAIYSATTGVAEIVPIVNFAFAAADLIVLTKNQLVMAYKVALAAGKEGSPRRIMGEVVSVLGGGFLFRQLARELVGLIPVIGIVPKIVVAYAGTRVIGRTVAIWATEGERLNRDEMRRFFDEAVERGRIVADAIVGTVQDKVAQLPMPGANGQGDGGTASGEESLLQSVRKRLPFNKG